VQLQSNEDSMYLSHRCLIAESTCDNNGTNRFEFRIFFFEMMSTNLREKHYCKLRSWNAMIVTCIVVYIYSQLDRTISDPVLPST